MRTSNPVLGDNVFSPTGYAADGQAMTLQGTVNKCLILLGIILASAWWVWGKVMQPAQVLGYEVEGLARHNQQAVLPIVFIAGIVGFVVALITVFKKEWSAVTAPVYALCEGLLLGGVSGLFEMMYPGIVMQAVVLTFGTLLCLLFAYKSGFIRVTDKFRLGVFAATAAIGLFYFVTWILGFFHVTVPFINGGGIVGIGFSLFVVGIAALNLVLDFDMIERGAESGAPKYMEWYGAFGLMVTLIWLYMEILRLLSKLRSRD
ncbi:MAG: Bax inhibitor-1/YccA family protein [Candidatus Omnitrophica bacterium]|nr:Bax inhibitor-1/YccA family protein [Candidatus Omnitrophota bacterium]